MPTITNALSKVSSCSQSTRSQLQAKSQVFTSRCNGKGSSQRLTTVSEFNSGQETLQEAINVELWKKLCARALKDTVTSKLQHSLFVVKDADGSTSDQDFDLFHDHQHEEDDIWTDSASQGSSDKVLQHEMQTDAEADSDDMWLEAGGSEDSLVEDLSVKGKDRREGCSGFDEMRIASMKTTNSSRDVISASMCKYVSAATLSIQNLS